MNSQRDEQSPPSQRNRVQRNIMIATLDSARNIVMFCPMLAILFVACRMRALQLTANKGAPPGWAQDCMYVATFSSLGQLFVIVLIGIQSASENGKHVRKSRRDEDDEEMSPARSDR